MTDCLGPFLIDEPIRPRAVGSWNPESVAEASLAPVLGGEGVGMRGKSTPPHPNPSPPRGEGLRNRLSEPPRQSAARAAAVS
jgi:hypothetical protein